MIKFSVFLAHRLLKEVVVGSDKITMGRSDGNDIVLQDIHVSRCHILIRKKQGQYWIEDTSSNGITLDGEPFEGTGCLPKKCQIGIFPFLIDYLCYEDDQTRPIPESGNDGVSPSLVVIAQDPSVRKPVTSHFGSMIGESPAMQAVYKSIQAVSNKDATVLIRGEHGTGKELVVRAIHELSPRKNGPLISLNCAAIPEHLIESEIFGYEKGAFSGASAQNKGKIGGAIGGTLFLDEIGELSLVTQAKFLRFLEDKSFMRLGSEKEICADVRVIAATNRDLEQDVEKGAFRADLYYRIKVLQVSLPPLRERAEDIPRLIEYFVDKFTAELGLLSVPILKLALIEKLQASKWPGNIRQLNNTIYSALVQSEFPHLITEDLLFPDAAPLPNEEVMRPSFTDASRDLLLKVLKAHQGSTQKAAAELGVSRATIYNRLKKYGIDLKDI